MHFVGNDAWFAVLISIHIIGAIIGIGPGFTFGLLGPLAGTMPGPGGLALLKGIHRIGTVLVNPVFLATQWISGTLLIFNRGLNHDFFSGHRRWLLVAIVLYAILLVLDLTVTGPGIKKMIAAGEQGDGATVQRLAIRQRNAGIVFPIFLIAIMVLMIWKPGSGCGPLLRC